MKCEICNNNKKDLGFFQGLYCCKECFYELTECNAFVLEGKYIIYQMEIKVK